MNRSLTSWTATLRAQSSTKILCAFIYGWLALQSLVLFFDKDILWGLSNVFFRFGQSDRFVENAVLRLYYQAEIFPLVYYGSIVTAVLGMLNHRWSFLPRILAWATGMLLYSAASAAYGWSMPLMLNMAFIAAFIHDDSLINWRNSLNSILLWNLRLQGLIFFLVMAAFQWGASQWTSGTAMYYQWHLDYSLRECFHAMRESLLPWARMFTYAWMLYCSAFPLLIWIRGCRRILIRAGLGFTLVYGLLWSNGMNDIALLALLLPWMHWPTQNKLERNGELTSIKEVP
jgi:hypothetical protein